MMLNAAKLIAAKRPRVRFLIAAYREKQAALIREQLADNAINVELHIGKTAEIIEVATACIAVSGSVGLEMLVRLKPTVVVYRSGLVLQWLYRRMRTCDYISLVNLLADAPLFPEYAGTRDESAEVAGHILNWLEHPDEREALVGQLRELRDRVAEPGAVERAAEFLIAELSPVPPTPAVPSSATSASCASRRPSAERQWRMAGFPVSSASAVMRATHVTFASPRTRKRSSPARGR